MFYFRTPIPNNNLSQPVHTNGPTTHKKYHEQCYLAVLSSGVRDNHHQMTDHQLHEISLSFNYFRFLFQLQDKDLCEIAFYHKDFFFKTMENQILSPSFDTCIMFM